ncbi:MAG: GTP cyclohydrolase II [Stappiaceae bacterium]
MQSEHTEARRNPFGTASLTPVQRALTELAGHRPLCVQAGTESRFMTVVENLDQTTLDRFSNILGSGGTSLVITGQRAQALGHTADVPATIRVNSGDTVETLKAIAMCDPRTISANVAEHDVAPAGPVARAALELAKTGRHLPAVLLSERRTPDENERLCRDFDIQSLSADTIMGFRETLAHTLSVASDARVPLDNDIDTRFVVFRDAIGNISTAVVIGDPATDHPLPIRIHSSCVTGDIFGSRRCDCGPQLQMALKQINELGGGCLLYLEQEGRGIGLANKMRAYRLQDNGLDTVDANTALGFHDDERDYFAATAMLRSLGWNEVELLTNNPQKVAALTSAGMNVVRRLPVLAPVNADNHRYLKTKAQRAGHWLDHVEENESETVFAAKPA